MSSFGEKEQKFVNFALGSGKGKCDEVVSFPKDGDGKGNKTLVSAHSGYAVELVGVVDGTEKALLAKESGLRGNLEKMRADMETLSKAREHFEKIAGVAGDDDADEGDATVSPEVADAREKLAEIGSLEQQFTEAIGINEKALDGVVTDLLDRH